MRRYARPGEKAGVQVVTGDTKVVERGRGDGDIYQHRGHRLS
ncbi:MAG: hypothetical protein V8S72_06055 [Oscillospiraceae bacterium]